MLVDNTAWGIGTSLTSTPTSMRSSTRSPSCGLTHHSHSCHHATCRQVHQPGHSPCPHPCTCLWHGAASCCAARAAAQAQASHHACWRTRALRAGVLWHGGRGRARVNHRCQEFKSQQVLGWHAEWSMHAPCMHHGRYKARDNPHKTFRFAPAHPLTYLIVSNLVNNLYNSNCINNMNYTHW